MKMVTIFPYPKSESGWLTWPGIDEHPKGYEHSGVGIREKIFGITKDVQNQVSMEIFFNMRTGSAGSFPIFNVSGEFVFNGLRALHEELHIKIENN